MIKEKTLSSNLTQCDALFMDSKDLESRRNLCKNWHKVVPTVPNYQSVWDVPEGSMQNVSERDNTEIWICLKVLSYMLLHFTKHLSFSCGRCGVSGIFFNLLQMLTKNLMCTFFFKEKAYKKIVEHWTSYFLISLHLTYGKIVPLVFLEHQNIRFIVNYVDKTYRSTPRTWMFSYLSF